MGTHWVEAVDNSSMGTHTGPTSYWVEAGGSRLTIALWGHTGLRQLTIALWGHTLDQHHTGLRQVEVG